MTYFLAWQFLCGVLLTLNVMNLVGNLRLRDYYRAAISGFASCCCLFAMVA